MQLYILLIFFIILLIVTYKYLKKDIAEPSIIYIAAYIVSITCAIINIKAWSIDYSIKAFLIILLGCIEFVLISFIINKICNKSNQKEKKEFKYKSCNINKIITYILIIYNVIALIVLVYNVLKIAGQFGTYSNFSEALNIYKHNTSYIKNAELPNYVTILIKPIIATAYIYAYLFLKKIIYAEKLNFKYILKNSYYLIPCLIFIIQKLCESNRGSILNFLLSVTVMYFIIFNVKHNWQIKIKIKNITKLFVIGIIVFILFYFSASLIGRINSKGIVDYITCYAGGSIENFNLYIKDEPIVENSLFQTFGRTIRDLNKLGIINTEVRDTDVHEYRYYKDNMIGNVYTSFRRWYQDYGIMGIIVFQAILAILFNLFYKFIKFFKGSEKVHDYIIIIYSYLIYTIFMHPIDSLFFLETFTIATAGVFIMITVIYFVITSNKVNNIICKCFKVLPKQQIKNKNNNVKDRIKILYVTPELNVCGGIESYCMNYYMNFSDNIEVDFATHNINDDYYKNIIEKKGNCVYVFPKFNLKNLFSIIKEINKFFKEHNDYDIVHCNMANAALFYFYYARKYGIKIRIIHSHQNSYADTLSHKIRNIPLIFFGKILTTHGFACSKLAGDFLFKNKKYYIINNALDVPKYNFNSDIRIKMRKMLNYTDSDYVIGNVGRLTEQKNQEFLLNIFIKMLDNNKKFKLLIIGEGHLKEHLMKKVKDNNIENYVIFTGSVNNVNDYLQAMDAFVLPSIYEGLGIVNIEAQASGLPCIVSDRVPPEAKITDLLNYVSLESGADYWCELLLKIKKNKYRKKYNQIVCCTCYNIETQTHELEKIYFDIIKETQAKER